MIKKTFEELVQNDSVTFEPYDNTRFLDVRDVILLLKQVRQATIKECIELSKIKYYAGETGYLDKNSILDLDKDSIEVDE